MALDDDFDIGDVIRKQPMDDSGFLSPTLDREAGLARQLGQAMPKT